MKLSVGNRLVIPKKKLLNYLLSKTHTTGKFKAKFFKSLGFNETNILYLTKVLRIVATSYEVKDVLKSLYGTKYIIDGEIDTPSGKIVKVRTVWIIENNQNNPRLITVYPL